jgi:hypothetical protein
MVQVGAKEEQGDVIIYAIYLFGVVPAKAGTHNHRAL